MIEIPLTKGYVAIVDECDADLLQYSWRALITDGHVYAVRSFYIGKKQHGEYMHRAILERMIGKKLTSKDKADHILGKTLDNRRSEIRLATNAQNVQNCDRSTRNTSGYKGVSYSTYHQKYRAQIMVNKRKLHLGWFVDPAEAHTAYCEAAIKHFGEFANFGTPRPMTIIQLPLFELDKAA